MVDNPPFSILAEITKFYGERGIRYFLFAPGLTCFAKDDGQRCAVCVGVPIIYENKADVNTSFVTNLLPDYVAITDPDLYKAVKKAAEEYAEGLTTDLPKYAFPDEVVTAAKMNYLAKYGQTIKIKRDEAVRVSGLDAMKADGRDGIFGGGGI